MIPIGTDLTQYAFGPAQNFFAAQPGVPTQISPLAPPAPFSGSPFANPAEARALDALSSNFNAFDPPNTGPQSTDVGVGPTGRPSTGSVMGDARAAHNAGLTSFGLGALANPAALATQVPATLAAIGINAMTGAPAKSLGSVMGLRGLANQLSEVPTAIRNAIGGLPSKPEGFTGQINDMAKSDPDAGDRPGALSAAEAQAQADNAATTGDMGGAKGAPGDGDGGKGSPGDGGSKGDNFAQGGLIQLAGGGKIATGPGGGLDDLIPTSIDGRRAAALSDGEFVIPADVVSMMGDGSSNAGSQRLYDLVRSIREAKTGTSEQAGPLPVGDILKRISAR